MKAGIIQSIFIILLFFFGSNIFSQQKKQLELDKCARLEGGLIIGGQILNDNLIYNPGGSFQYSYCIKSGNNVGFGLGAGIQFFEEEAFIPFYFDFIGMLNKHQNAPFLEFQAGYAMAWSNKYKNVRDYAFTGGIYFSTGIGRKFKFNDTFSSYISLSYKHQFASLTYTAFTINEYYEKLNYDMLVLSIGIMLEQ
jgi:hypothetical protein